MHLGLSLTQRVEQTIGLRQELTLKQELALKLAQELKITIKQLLRLFPQLKIISSVGTYLPGYTAQGATEASLERSVGDCEKLASFLETRPSSYELRKEFPVFAQIFDEAHRQRYVRYTQSQARQRPAQPQMSLTLQLRPALATTQSIVIAQSLPTNWSLVDAYTSGKKTSDFPKTTIPGIDGLSLVERLKAVDAANEVFHYSYQELMEKDEKGREVKRFYKVPLLRDRTIDESEIREPISEKAYRSAMRKIDGVAHLDRIARAVPYTELHFAARAFAEEHGASVDDIVLVGVDRGGRVPTLIMKEALGKDRAYFLKVDQGGRKIDYRRFKELVDSGVFKGKFVMFVDSTVDSGRQIEALKGIMSQHKEAAQYRGWGLVGSNENGLDLIHHRNINWGLDPDQSFEDDVRLMGVDYADDSHTKVAAAPSETSSAIRTALLEVPRGSIFDFAQKKTGKTLEEITDVPAEVEAIVGSEKWRQITSKRPQAHERPLQPYQAARKLMIAVSGSSNGANRFSEQYLETVGESLIPFADILYVGTEIGGPGAIMRGVAKGIEEVVVVRPETERGRIAEIKANAAVSNVEVSFGGSDKEEHRRALAGKGEVHIVLDGGRGTLTEAMYAIQSGKQTIVLSSSNVGRYIRQRPGLRQRPNVCLADDFGKVLDAMKAYSAKS